MCQQDSGATAPTLLWIAILNFSIHRLQLEEWASPASSSMTSTASLASLFASWLPLLVVGLLLFLAWRQLTIVVEENHRREEALTPYSYFHILKWP